LRLVNKKTFQPLNRIVPIITLGLAKERTGWLVTSIIILINFKLIMEGTGMAIITTLLEILKEGTDWLLLV
jgi:hypothetical protein